MGNCGDLFVFQLSYDLAKKIFFVSKLFPKDELYGLTDQIRRSSRSICTNIGEAYRKRIYPKHFVNKVSDADGECLETLIWLQMAKDYGYLDQKTFKELSQEYERVGRILGSMIQNPEKFCHGKN